LRYEADDLGAELRSYLERLDGEPGQLEHVEERLAAFSRLARKHGGSVADAIAHAERCRARARQLEYADESLAAVEGELARVREQLDSAARELSEVRTAAAPRLAREVQSRLAELAMAQARFEVEVRRRADGCGPRGLDTVEFRIAANPGMPLGPLREVASGGELSRVMLALLSVAHGTRGGQGAGKRGGARRTAGGRERDGTCERDGGRELLVFDEIDAGIGGHTARDVARHLRGLAGGRQLLCITHLPQIAALADRHFTIVKDTSGASARTTVSVLDGEDVVGELVRMLGADGADKAARGHARELLRAA
jgi:DNA repair protein RecN (Recombination protein N)